MFLYVYCVLLCLFFTKSDQADQICCKTANSYRRLNLLCVSYCDGFLRVGPCDHHGDKFCDLRTF